MKQSSHRSAPTRRCKHACTLAHSCTHGCAPFHSPSLRPPSLTTPLPAPSLSTLTPGINLFAKSDNCFTEFFKSNYNLLDLLVVTLSVIALVGSFFSSNVASLRVLRLARVLRVLRLFRGIASPPPHPSLCGSEARTCPPLAAPRARHSVVQIGMHALTLHACITGRPLLPRPEQNRDGDRRLYLSPSQCLSPPLHVHHRVCYPCHTPLPHPQPLVREFRGLAVHHVPGALRTQSAVYAALFTYTVPTERSTYRQCTYIYSP